MAMAWISAFFCILTFSWAYGDLYGVMYKDYISYTVSLEVDGSFEIFTGLYLTPITAVATIYNHSFYFVDEIPTGAQCVYEWPLSGSRYTPLTPDYSDVNIVSLVTASAGVFVTQENGPQILITRPTSLDQTVFDFTSVNINAHDSVYASTASPNNDAYYILFTRQSSFGAGVLSLSDTSKFQESTFICDGIKPASVRTLQFQSAPDLQKFVGLAKSDSSYYYFVYDGKTRCIATPLPDVAEVYTSTYGSSTSTFYYTYNQTNSHFGQSFLGSINVATGNILQPAVLKYPVHILAAI